MLLIDDDIWQDMLKEAREGEAKKMNVAMWLTQIAFEGQTRYGGKRPMSIHSMMVGLELNLLGADINTVVAGFCHDMLEDTEVSIQQLELLFGTPVRRIVEACSLNKELYNQSHEEGNQDLFRRVEAAGPSAVHVKLADILNNLATIHQVPAEWQQEMLFCAKTWAAIGQRVRGANDPATQRLNNRLAELDLRAEPSQEEQSQKSWGGYRQVTTATNLRRSFAITVGLREGFAHDGACHSSSEAAHIVRDWIAQRITDGKPHLNGGVSEIAHMTYGWLDGDTPQTQSEPAALFSGFVSVRSQPDLPDTEVEDMLTELAARLGSQLRQDRVNIEYRDKTWVIETTQPLSLGAQP